MTSEGKLVKEQVAAVIVTRNRLPLLKRCLDYLLRQTRSLDAIYVVDVASDDGRTVPFLQSCSAPIKPLYLPTNAGGAGGFSAGIERASADGFDWVWCMDDDGYPSEEALEKLLQFSDRNEAKWLNSLVASIDNPGHLAFGLLVYNSKVPPGAGRIEKEEHEQGFKGTHCILKTVQEAQEQGLVVENSNPFNGTLIHKSLIDSIGVPNPNFFIWGDEHEYRRRAMRSGTKLLTITDSIFYHPASNSAMISEVAWKQFWKHYYYIRNYGATAYKDGQVEFSYKGARSLGGIYIQHLLVDIKSSIIDIARSFAKIFIVLRAILAARLNDTKRYYPKNSNKNYAPPALTKQPPVNQISAKSEVGANKVSPERDILGSK